MSVTISLGALDSLIVEFPPHPDPMLKHFKPHVVTIPFSEHGLSVLRRILVAQRDDAPRNTINFPQLPTQYLVDKWIKEAKQKKNSPPTEKLDLEGIEL